MLKHVLVAVAAFLMLMFFIAVLATAMPHETVGVETATPQQVYFRLHQDDELTVKP